MRASCRLASADRGALALSFLLASAASAAAVEIPYSTAQTIGATVSGATSAELADLDGDGDLDAVGTAGTANEISWWENTVGDGSAWTLHTIASTFGGAISVQVADLDRDGLPDVVAAARADDDVAWFRNDGTPAIGTWTRYSVATAVGGARAVRVADLDRDGAPDLVAAAETTGSVVWWQSSGTPTADTTDLGGGDYWVRRTISSTVPGAISIDTGDIDGDGFLDVMAAAYTSGAIGWIRNDGDPTDGGWTGRFVDSAFTDPRAVTLADLDGDGDLDLLAGSDQASDEVAWWVNDGDPTDDGDDGAGNFWTQYTIADAFDGGTSVRAVDLDQDGDLDVLGAAATADEVAWWENDGDPTDDTVDLGGGDFWVGRTVDAAFDGARHAVAGDVDGDGDLDLAAVSFGGDAVSWWQNETIHRSAFLASGIEVTTVDQPEGIDLADVDRDGDLDLVTGSSGSQDRIAWWENDGTPDGPGWTEHSIGLTFTQPRAVSVGDLDGDGDPDVVATMSVFGVDFGWWENDGTPEDGGWIEHVLTADASVVTPVELADLDRDGDLDVIFADSGADAVSWFENDGSACSPGCTWPEHSIRTAFGNPRYLGVADFDRDGDPDVAGHSPTDQLLVWWENDGDPAGDPAWTEHGIDAGGETICPVEAADLDGDGDADVLSCPGSETSLRWFENDGTPAGDASWAAQSQIVAAPATAQSATAVDLDGDGDLDVAASIADTSVLEDLFFAWWENSNGDGSAWVRHDLASEVDLPHVVVGDVDGDGKVDLATTNAGTGTVRWWPNGGGQLALTTVDLSSGGILNGTADDLLAVTATHRGRTGDSAAELATFSLLFEETPGDPLSTAEAQALIDSLQVYLDDGSGGFDGADILVTTVSPLVLAAGVQTVALPAGTDVQIPVDGSKTYLVVATTTVDASAHTPSVFRVTHLAGSGTARDAAALVPLDLEHADTVATGQMTAQGGCLALTLSHTGGGAALVPTPAQSSGCGAGQFVPDEVVSLQAAPDTGWEVSGWTGTDDDGSTATSNTVTMPATAHAASVAYAFPDELILDGEFLSGTQVKEACLTIQAGDVPGVDPAGLDTAVGASAAVTLRAGATVVLHDGFQVFENATLVIEIATPAQCLP